MKKPIILMLIFFSLTACDKDLLDVNFSTELSQTSDEIVVNDTPAINSKMVAVGYETEFILSLSNPDTEKYLNKIQEIDLDEVKLYFPGLEILAGNTTEYFLTIYINGNEYELEVNPVIYDQLAQGVPLEISDKQLLETIANSLLNRKQVTIRISGFMPADQLYRFRIRLTTRAEITAKAL
jgi:hypothetical protein